MLRPGKRRVSVAARSRTSVRLVAVVSALTVAVASSLLLLHRAGSPPWSDESAAEPRGPAVQASRASGLPTPRVEGRRLVDAAGRPLQLRGVNRSGLEYACIQGWGMFDGPSDAASVAAMASWGVNTVRVPLNEDCWLDRDVAAREYSGSAYRDAVERYVDLLHQHDLAVVLSLQWSRAGDRAATTTAAAPDAAHAPAFWRSVAEAFADDPAVLFDLFNEPREIDWRCWRHGCEMPGGWRAAGMQELVDAVRSTGARQPLLLGGLSYANDVSGWLDNAPVDPLNQLVVSFHVYENNECSALACWERFVGRVAERVPVVTGEVGQEDGDSSFVENYMAWADDRDISYLGWSWNTWDQPTALIQDYSGAPTKYGEGVRKHLLTRAPPAGSQPPAEGMARPTSLISRGVSAFASRSLRPAARANDADYGQAWRSSSYPCWIAYDLSSVPRARRERVYSVWSNPNTYDYDAALVQQRTYNVPGDYVLEGNVASGGGKPPREGWRTLVEEHGNDYHSAEHLLDLAGSPWLRLRASSGSDRNAPQNEDCAFEWDVHDASSAVPESWIFYGDSITAGSMSPHLGVRDDEGAPVPTFSELVQAARPDRFPAQQAGGVGGLSLGHALSSGALARWLSEYSGTHVALGLGLNDVNSDAFDPAAFYSDLEAAVEQVTRSGMVPVVPTVIAARAPRVQASGPQANDMIRRLYREHAEVVEGPDLWSLFAARPELISSEDPLHPTEVGYGEIRRAWAQTALRVR